MTVAPRYASTPPPTPAFADPDRAKKIAGLAPALEKRIDGYFAKAKPPSLAVVVVADGKPIATKLLGARDLTTKAPPTSRTLYRIGSITKTFTAEALVSLRDDGLVHLDDPAEKYMPELARIEYPFADTPRFTLRQILTHTSGLPRLGDFDYTRADRDVTEAEMMAAVEHAKLANAPGLQSVYSNFAISLLGPLLARVAPEKSYRETIAKRITAPLGMTSTTFDPSTTPGAELATPYGKPDDPKPKTLWRLGASEASGGLWSSLDDMTKYLGFQLAAWPARADEDKGPIKRASLREAHTGAFPMSLSAEVKKEKTQAFSSSVGLTWQVEASCEFSRMVWHNGGIDGFRAVMAFLPDHGVGFVILANSIEIDVEDLQYELLEDIAAAKLEPRVAQAAPELRAAVNEWGASLATCDPSFYDTKLTKGFRSAVPKDAWQKICAEQGSKLGACSVVETPKVRGAREADFYLRCAKGDSIKVTATLAEEDGSPRFSGLLFTKRSTPSPAMLKAAEETLRTNEKIKTNNGTCKLAPAAATSLSDDGPNKAVMPLACDKRKNVELHLELDAAGKTKSIETHVNRRGGRCS